MDSLVQDEAAFLAKIRERPDDDTPRLVFADWLDEHTGEGPCPDAADHGRNRRCRRCDAVYVHIHKYSGCDSPGCGSEEEEESHPTACPTCNGTGRVSNGFRERAEFIRVQCELANTPASVVATNRCPVCDGPGVWRRGVGFDHEKRCSKCDETWEPGARVTTRRRDRLASREIQLSHIVRPQFGYEVKSVWFSEPENAEVFPLVVVRRGFISEFRGPLQSCLDHLPALVRHPSAVITRVRVTDRRPVEVHPSGWEYEVTDWSEGGLLRNFAVNGIPWRVAEANGRGLCNTFFTRELAESALSTALLRLAGNPITLPSLPGESDGPRGSDRIGVGSRWGNSGPRQDVVGT